MNTFQSRRTFLKHTAGAGAAIMFSGFSCELAERPNIIYILADDLGYGDLGCYGQQNIKTPNLDQMAAEGMKFTDHYAGSTVCAPSRCCLMTGKHTGHARIRGNADIPLRPQDITVAELLKQAGYKTGLIGKWGLGEAGSTGIPNKQGFDTFFGYLNQIRAHNYYPTFLWDNQEKMNLDNEVVIAKEGYSKGIGSAATQRNTYSHDLFAEKALSFIEQNSDSPFFLYLALTIPHANNEGHLVDRHGMEVPEYGIYKDKDWPEAQKGHAAMITRMDRDIGNLFDLLKTLGLDDNTVVMFTSDNGPHAEGGNDPAFNDSNGPLRGIKRDLYEGGIRVPMIARWPGRIATGSTTDLPSALWDVLPTCAELAGVSAPPDTDGISFLPTLLGEPETQEKHEYLYWEFHWWQPARQAVRMGRWKGVRNTPDSDIELYDLSVDIGEKHNIAKQHSDIVQRIASIMQSARTESENWPLLQK
ncbi:MAG: sulfatase-like hydrolase/transferase [candidate division KSB1 bacterium]|nr:sulfatase-like hydrolase/transferase [candidate division KSB1 bacterium]